MAADGALTRRQVLRYGMGGGLVLATGGAVASAAAPVRRGTDLEEATIAELRRDMRRGRLSSEELTQWYLERIEPSTRCSMP